MPGLNPNLVVQYNSTTHAITVTGGDNNGGDVSLPQGDGNTITWGAPNRIGWRFAFLSVQDGQFFMSSFSADQIVIVDNNRNSSTQPQDYEYSLAVFDTNNNTVYWDDPKIINKAPQG